MSVSEFQISLEGEEDLMDSLKETVRNSNKCLEAIMKRKKLQEEGIGLIEHDPIAMIKEKLKKVKESYKEDDLKEFNRIFKSTEMYLSKNIVEIIIKILVSDMDDYINGYSLVNKKIWQIKKERRELEDDFDNRNQESCSLETTKKQLEMKIKELTLQISIVKSEISTQSACISSIISKLEPKDQPFSEYLLCKPSI